MNLGARTAAWYGKSLPYDAEVEYITGYANNWFDTGVATDKDLIVRLKFATSSRSSSDAFGDWHGSDYTSQRVFFNSVDLIRYDIGSKRITMYFPSGQELSVDSPRVFEFGNFYVNDITFSNKQTSTTVTNFDGEGYTYKIFHSLQSLRCRIYSVYIEKSGITLRNMIPVRLGGLGFLYDKAHPKGGPLGNGLYGNANNDNVGFPSECVGPDASVANGGVS